MFHVVLVLPAILIIMAILAIIVFTAIVAIAASLIGGISVAALVKNKTVKKFLFMGFCIIFFAGLTIGIPFLTAYNVITETMGRVAACIFTLIIIAISIAGSIMAGRLSNATAKTALRIVFSAVDVIVLIVFLCFMAWRIMAP